MSLTEWKDVFALIDKLNHKIRSITGVYSEVNQMKAYYLFIHKCKELYRTCTCKKQMCNNCREKIAQFQIYSYFDKI